MSDFLTEEEADERTVAMREPAVGFGRCCVTGEFAPIVTVDLGTLNFMVPDYDADPEPNDEGVLIYPDKPLALESQVSLSARGLSILQEKLDAEGGFVIPGITPEDVYMWRVLHSDGSVITEYEGEKQNLYGDLDWSRIEQISYVPKMPGADLPVVSFVRKTGEFWIDGDLFGALLLSEAARFDREAPGVLAKQRTIVCSSRATTLDRTLETNHVGTLYLIGWQTGGIGNKGAPGYILGIDIRGSVRVFYDNVLP